MRCLSFVIPVYNSEKSIALVVGEIVTAIHNLEEKYEYEIILVNDFSKDNSLVVCKKLCDTLSFVKLISFCRNFGQHHAIMAGLRETKGDYVIILDDDLQTPPKEISKLIDAIEEGYDVVFAQYESKKYSLLRIVGSKLDDIMANTLIRKPKNIDTNSFVIIRKYIINEITKYDNVYLYLPGLIFRVTSNVGGVLVEHSERQFGKSNYNFRKLISLWLNGFTNFSVKPLRLSSMMGSIFSVMAFFIMIGLVVKKVLNPKVQMGWTSIMILIMFFGGIQLISLGLVGEYIGRIFLCINKTPQYVVKENYKKADNDE